MIVAYRSWLMGIRSGMLYSATAPNKIAGTQRFCWETDRVTAECNTLLRVARPNAGLGALSGCYHAPERRVGDKCGIYAYAGDGERHYASGDYGSTAAVWGVVGLWGEVHRHQLGYRAEHARILALVRHPRLRVAAYPAVRLYDNATALRADWGRD